MYATFFLVSTLLSFLAKQGDAALSSLPIGKKPKNGSLNTPSLLQMRIVDDGLLREAMQKTKSDRSSLVDMLVKLGLQDKDEKRKESTTNYHTVEACKKSVTLKMKYGDIVSPGFLRNKKYPNKASCQWIIRAPKDMIIRLVPLHVDIDCDDTLNIYEKKNGEKKKLIESMCGRDVSASDDQEASVIKTKTNIMIIEFKSGSKGRAFGFKLHYSSIVPCGVPTYKPNVYPLVDPSELSPVPWTSKVKGATKKRSLIDVIGGTVAKAHSWPFQVAIVCGWQYLCGGTIIHKRWILTAAHCVASFKPEEVVIDIGKHTVASFTFSTTITKIILHSNAETNDIALLRLSRPITFNDVATPVCLPHCNLRPNTMGFILGWGMSETEAPSSSLRQAAIPVIKSSICQRPDWLGDLVKDNMMCAGYADGGVDTCYGDSGGPLVAKGSGVWTIYGVVSFGVPGDCAQPKKPGVYMKVAEYLEWIQSSTNGDVTTL